MKVEKISAVVRYSQDTGKGAWKVIELGAEGSISEREDWKQSQAELYHTLTHQLRTLWANGSTNGTAVNGRGGAESQIPGPAESEPTPTARLHWCQAHDTLFKRRQKAGVIWYSHKAPDGSWCSEPVPAQKH